MRFVSHQPRLCRAGGSACLAGCISALLIAGCADCRDAGTGSRGGSDTGADPADVPGDPPLSARDLTIDAAAAPRGDSPLIAGEPVRIGIRILGGTPPYQGRLRAVQQSGSRDAAEIAPLDREFTATPNRSDARGVELGMQAITDPKARSGVFRLHATVVDARGQRATATSPDWTVIGDDASVHPLPRPGSPHVEVVDVAGRRRRAFVRGERVTIRAHIPGRTRAAVALHDPTGKVLARSPNQSLSPDGDLALPIEIPRLARPGSYRVAITASPSLELSAAIEVAGKPFLPLDRLTVDQLRIYGGDDGRAPRAASFSRGETLTLEARVGGGRKQVVGALRVQHPDGRIAAKTEFGRADITDPARDARVFVRGAWRVPETLAPGRYQLHVEATEEDHVSTRYREVVID